MRNFAIGLMIAALAVNPRAVSAQITAAASDQAAIEQLVLTDWIARTSNDSMRRKAFYADWAVNPRLEERLDGLEWRPSSQASRGLQESRRLAVILGSGIVLSQPDTCSDDYCRLGSRRGVLSFTPVIVRGDTAEVDLISRQRPSSAKRRLLTHRTRWTFVRDPNGWRKLRHETVIIS